jgi:hypothetical protein
MAWFQTFDSAFFLTLAGIAAGIIGVLVNSCLKSRCKTVKCLGMECERDTEEEGREAMARPENIVASSV